MTEKSYSQNGEQKIITDFFAGRVGRFLDVGAYDGLTFSNTRRLLELGWHGVLVEPSPKVIPGLRRNVAEFDDRACVFECAIGDSNGRVKFFDNAGAVATTSRDHVLKWSVQTTFDECDVLSMTPELLLDLVGTDFDFVSIDTEGTNMMLVKLFPWHRLPGCRLVCVEHDSADKSILEILEPFGFSQLARNGENLILSR